MIYEDFLNQAVNLTIKYVKSDHPSGNPDGCKTVFKLSKEEIKEKIVFSEKKA